MLGVPCVMLDWMEYHFYYLGILLTASLAMQSIFIIVITILLTIIFYHYYNIKHDIICTCHYYNINYRVPPKSVLKIVRMISPVLNILEGWDIFHLKCRIHSIVWSTGILFKQS